MKSPQLGMLDSPVGSDDEGEFDDDFEQDNSPAAEAMREARAKALETREEVEQDREERANRATSRGRGRSQGGGGGGADVLDIFEKLNKGIKD